MASCLVWAAVVLAGFLWLLNYGQQRGAIAAPPRAADESIPLAPEGMTLVMAVHPRCPCTRASVGELDRLLARCATLSSVVLVYRPSDAPMSWTNAASTAHLDRLPRTTTLDDPDGALASRLGAHTSGSVILYDSGGIAIFWGGITSARGHAGDNAGSSAIMKLVDGADTVTATTPVFGCELTDPAACEGVCR